MTRLLIAIATVSLAILMSACPPRHGLVIYNNTHLDLEVSAGGRQIAWSAGKVLRIAQGGDLDWDEMSWVDDGDGIRSPLLVVRRGGDEYRYRLTIPGLPDEYFAWRSGIRERHVQLEPTWALYAVPAGAAFPVSPLPKQVQGLPLEPTES